MPNQEGAKTVRRRHKKSEKKGKAKLSFSKTTSPSLHGQSCTDASLRNPQQSNAFTTVLLRPNTSLKCKMYKFIISYLHAITPDFTKHFLRSQSKPLAIFP